LSGVLGDVVSYAMDPAQAHRVRSVIEAEIKFFHDCHEVSSLHVFAHSQGTPITFEVLFHHLPDAYRRKIRTYVTIGSVLSYVHQATACSTRSTWLVFPVEPYPDFADEFKWINFWNLADPVTEFYGLDEYNLVVQAPVYLQNAGGSYVRASRPMILPLWRPSALRPAQTNIKTAATPANHSEYWENNRRVQGPFAKRVFGDLRPHEWDREQPEETVRGKSRAVGEPADVFVVGITSCWCSYR
jgi:pimeloyl-ACP methyl ester carboxylesterase